MLVTILFMIKTNSFPNTDTQSFHSETSLLLTILIWLIFWAHTTICQADMTQK